MAPRNVLEPGTLIQFRYGTEKMYGVVIDVIKHKVVWSKKVHTAFKYKTFNMFMNKITLEVSYNLYPIQ